MDHGGLMATAPAALAFTARHRRGRRDPADAGGTGRPVNGRPITSGPPAADSHDTHVWLRVSSVSTSTRPAGTSITHWPSRAPCAARPQPPGPGGPQQGRSTPTAAARTSDESAAVNAADRTDASSSRAGGARTPGRPPRRRQLPERRACHVTQERARPLSPPRPSSGRRGDRARARHPRCRPRGRPRTTRAARRRLASGSLGSFTKSTPFVSSAIDGLGVSNSTPARPWRRTRGARARGRPRRARASSTGPAPRGRGSRRPPSRGSSGSPRSSRQARLRARLWKSKTAARSRSSTCMRRHPLRQRAVGEPVRGSGCAPAPAGPRLPSGSMTVDRRVGRPWCALRPREPRKRRSPPSVATAIDGGPGARDRRR